MGFKLRWKSSREKLTFWTCAGRLREGAKAACFYTPDAGQRYRELGGQD